MNDYYETETVSEAPGLEARVRPDECYENPLEWVGVKECGKGDLVKGSRCSDPAWLEECPTCHYSDGSTIGSRPGMIVEVRKGGHGSPDTFDRECPTCKGEGERLARSSEEWCRENGATAAVPVRYNVDGSQPWIRVVEWGDEEEEPQSVLYLEGEGRTVAEIEGAIEDLETAWHEGFSWVEIVVSEDSELPADVLEGFFEVQLGGMLGWKWAEEEAERMLLEAYAYVKRELEERRAWAERDVVTV